MTERTRKLLEEKQKKFEIVYLEYGKILKIKCLKHNKEYSQDVYDHLACPGSGCLECKKEGFIKRLKTPEYQRKAHTSNPKTAAIKYLSKEKQKERTQEFIKKAQKVWGDLYDYSVTEYTGTHNPFYLICKKHGKVKVAAALNHLRSGMGCPFCGKEKKEEEFEKHRREKFEKAKNNFFEEAKVVWDDFYDYSKFEYKGCKIQGIIICPAHGKFQKTPNAHLSHKQGCPLCEGSKVEKLFRALLKRNKIKFEIEKKFKDCRDIRPLPFDFYLPNQNLLIEFQGKQHYEFSKLFKDTEEKFNLRKKHDKTKEEYCKKKGFKLLQVPYTQFSRIKLLVKSIISQQDLSEFTLL